jgi:hypothetical protein
VREEWKTAIVVPLPDPVPPRALLSQFLRDPLTRDEGLALACGENWTDAAIGTLRTLASFYGVEAAIVRVRAKATPSAALDAVAKLSSAGQFLLLGETTIGRAPGWRRALYAASQTGGPASCVSPTVLYEDTSIRFAGTERIELLDAAPYVHVRRRFAGMPAPLVASSTSEQSIAGSLACCLFPREVIDRIGMAARATATPSGEEAELFRRIHEAGSEIIWSPSAQVYSADELGAGAGGGWEVGRLIDGWCLRAQLVATARKE